MSRQKSSISRRNFLSSATTGIAAATVVTGVARAADRLPNENGPYDVVIQGGRVIDPETKLDAVRNIGLKGDRIAAISTEPLEGSKTLQAEGMVVAPGFIDMHAHGQQLPAAWVQAFDGVTTALELESGLFPVGQAYDRIGREGRPINYGLGVAWSFARVQTMVPDFEKPDGTLGWFQKAFAVDGWQNALPNQAQLEQIVDLVESGLKEGALALSINAGYAPGIGRKEYYALAELAKKHNVATHTHNRSMSVLEPKSSFESIVEQIGLAGSTGAHMHICHLNSTSNRDLKAATRLIKEAQDNGLPVTVEAYPYGAFSTAIGAEFMRGDDWLDRFGGTDYGSVELRGKPLTKEKIEELQRSKPGEAINFHFLREETSESDQQLLDLAVLFPGGSIASDAMPWFDDQGKIVEGDVWPLPKSVFAHPRSSGCFSRFIARWVRQRKSISLSDALAKTSLIPSQVLQTHVPQMKKKGRIQVGCDADILVFDFEKIEDKGTFVVPAQLASGKRHVVVGGVAIIEDGKRMDDVMPGRPVRREV